MAGHVFPLGQMAVPQIPEGEQAALGRSRDKVLIGVSHAAAY